MPTRATTAHPLASSERTVMTSKADKLRAAMRTAGTEGITAADVKRITGSTGAISNMLRTGEVTRVDRDQGSVYIMAPGYEPKPRGSRLPIKRPKKKPRGHKKARRAPRSAKTYKTLADKITANRRDADSGAVSHVTAQALAVGNLVSSSDRLAKLLEAEVQGLEKNPLLVDAIDRQKRDVELVRALGADTPF